LSEQRRLTILAAVALGVSLAALGFYVATRGDRGARGRSAGGARGRDTASAHATSAVSPGAGSVEVTPASGPTAVSVPQGDSAAAGAWVSAFVLRASGGTATSVLEAYRVCRSTQTVLCSEAQWQAACGRDASLGGSSSWTARIRDGHAVRRGGRGCGDAGLANAGESLHVVCCDPGVATVGTSEAFLHATNDKLRAYQSAIHASDAARAAALVDDTLWFDGKPMTRAGYEHAALTYFRQHPQTLMYDRCDVEVRKEEDGWRAVCGLLMAKDDRLFSLEHTLFFGGPLGKIQRLGEDHVRPVE